MLDGIVNQDNIRDLYYTIIEQSPSSILMTDVNGSIEYANPKYLELTGYSMAELIGRKPSILKSGYTTQEEYQDLWQTVLSGKTWRGILRNKKRNGDLFWEKAVISPVFNDEGKIVKLVGIKTDITKERELEAENRMHVELINKLFENALVGIFFMMLDEPLDWKRVKDKRSAMKNVFEQQKITMVNQAFADQYRTSTEKLIGLTPKDFFEHGIMYGYEIWERFFDQGYLEINTDERKSDGTPMWVIGSYICLYDEQNQIIGHFGMQLEITELIDAKKALEEEITRSEQLRREANRANEAKSLFLANVSHELRTPLNAIIGFAQLSRNSEQGENDGCFSEHIIRASHDLLRILNELLDLSSAEANRMQFDEKPFDLRKTIKELLDQGRVLSGSKPILIDQDVSTDVPEMMIGDELRINQILRNLLFNAIKYTNRGSIRLTASVKTQSENWVELMFSIQDTGTGIQQNRLETIFEPFSTTETIPTNGVGLGLALAKTLVEQMDGRIWVERTSDAGSTFSFTIKLKKVGRQLLESGNQEEKKAFDGEPLYHRLSGLNILLAEDNPLNQEIVLIALSKVGVRTTVAENGVQCLERLKEDRFDVVLMDLQMPVMDGYETTRIIRETWDNETLPIIAMTANALTEEKNKCLEVGMNDYITKPFMMEELYKVLTDWVSI